MDSPPIVPHLPTKMYLLFCSWIDTEKQYTQHQNQRDGGKYYGENQELYGICQGLYHG